jgi:FkbH-like protein
MRRSLSKIRDSLARDQALPLSARVAKGVRYVASSVLAPVRLRACDRVGARGRAMGRPRIVNRGRIEIGDDFTLNSIFAPAELVAAEGATIEIGDRVGINYGTAISARARVKIGNGVSIGPYSIIADSEAELPDGDDDRVAPIEIGDGVWLAARVTLLPGARIGAGSVITAGSIVSGEIPAGVVAGGIPARVLRAVKSDDSAAPAQSWIPASAGMTEGGPGGAIPSVIPAEAGIHTSPNGAPAPPALSGVVIADFTIGDLAVRLRDATDSPSLIVAESPYGQVMQQLMSGPSEGATDFAVVWTLPQLISPAFQRVEWSEPVEQAELTADVDAFCDVLLRAAAGYRFIFVPTWTLPAHRRGLGMIDARPGGLTWALGTMNQRLMERLGNASNVFVLNAARWAEAAGRGSTGTGERAWYLGKVAFHGEALAEAARDIKAAVRGLTGQARKLVVVDLDDTLWGGIVGDAGWENLQLGGHDPRGEAFVDFQRALKQLTRRGIVLGIASKNTESVALEAIRSHPAMILGVDDFVGWRINWDDKARNIADLAAELNLGLQSVVFIDDNPVERARVREALPEVLVPEWPKDPLMYPSALHALRCFDVPAISREDAERTRLYAAERERERIKTDVGSLDDWLAGLDIRVRVEPLGRANLTRVAQLFNKTNQMNLTTRRLTEQELVAWAEEPGHALWALSVGDRFGDAGLTGILGLATEGERCRIVDFILSCRVMGRRVEETMAHLAVEWALERSLVGVEALYIPSAKNKPCHDFWKERSRFASADEKRFVWDISEPYALPECITLERAL